MHGFLTTLVAGGAPRDSLSAGGRQPLGGGATCAADMASDTKIRTFQSFVRPENERGSLDNLADSVDTPEDDALQKGESPDDEIDAWPDPVGGEAGIDVAGHEPQTFETDLPLGSVETGELEDPAETGVPPGATAPLPAAQEAERWFSSQTRPASERATPAIATIPNDIQTAELPVQAPPSDESAMSSIAVALPQSSTVAGNTLSELAGAADAICGTLGSGVEALLRIDLPTVPAGASEVQVTPPGTSHGVNTARLVAAQMLEVMIRSSEHSIDVFLNPVELGRVRLTLMQAEAGMIVNVTAERAETLDLMRRHSDILGQEFQDLGYGDTDFNFAREGQTGGRDQARGDALTNSTPQPEFQAAGGISLRMDLTDRLDIRL